MAAVVSSEHDEIKVDVQQTPVPVPWLEWQVWVAGGIFGWPGTGLSCGGREPIKWKQQPCSEAIRLSYIPDRTAISVFGKLV